MLAVAGCGGEAEKLRARPLTTELDEIRQIGPANLGAEDYQQALFRQQSSAKCAQAEALALVSGKAWRDRAFFRRSSQERSERAFRSRRDLDKLGSLPSQFDRL